MKPITYLCFTILSVVVQFCLMDFINDQIGFDDTITDTNSSIDKKLNNVFMTFKQKPHALYYRTERGTKIKDKIKYNNYSLSETTTELTVTVFDVLYDENVSTTSNDSTTEMSFTSSEYDNVTEITFFDRKSSTVKPPIIPKKISTNKCYCNLLYKTCDINCCCDNECSEQQRSMLRNCEGSRKEKCDPRNKEYIHMCTSQFGCGKELQNDIFGYLFCIEKVNLPERPAINRNKLYALNMDSYLKWHVTNKQRLNIEITKTLYNVGQPIWTVTNGTISTLEMPITIINEYCTGKKSVKFLINENIQCFVKLKDLHMLEVIKSYETTKLASPKSSTSNSTKMDCTTLHCIDWTVYICKEDNCSKYNSNIHEPSCSESYCTNIGVKIEYEFYSNVSLITRAIIRFHVRSVSMATQIVRQEITVNFYMGNNSINDIVKFSGNPGYLIGLPVIALSSEGNHTEHFFNDSLSKRNNLLLPHNKDGECVLTNLTHNVVTFGLNKRLKCRLPLKTYLTMHNGTDGCLNVQAQIDEMYGLGHSIFISPLGNPEDVSDENWVRLQMFNKSNIYGEYRPKDSKLLCYNLITRIAFTIAFADMNDDNKVENKILSARVEGSVKNISFSIEDMSTVLTFDTNFINAKKLIMEDVESPYLNFHLPKDFFLPLAPNKCNFAKSHVIVLYVCVILSLSK